MHAVAVINAASGSGGADARVAGAREALADAGVSADVRAVHGSNVEAATGEALDEGARRVIIGGGDGTVSAAASVLSGSDAVRASCRWAR